MIEAIIARLQDSCPDAADVKGAEDLDILEDKNLPAVKHGTLLVIPYRERASENMLQTGGHRQLVNVQFVVAILVRRHGDAMGAQRAASFDGLKAQIEAALAGWTPGPTCAPCELVGGEGSPLGNGVSVYVQTWETSRYLEGARP